MSSNPQFTIEVDSERKQVIIRDPGGSVQRLSMTATLTTLIDLAGAMGRSILPVLVNTVVDMGYRMFEALAVGILNAIDRFGQTLIRRLGDVLESDIRSANAYSGGVRNAMRHAAALKFINAMERRGVTGLTVDMILSSYQ